VRFHYFFGIGTGTDQDFCHVGKHTTVLDDRIDVIEVLVNAMYSGRSGPWDFNIMDIASCLCDLEF